MGTRLVRTLAFALGLMAPITCVAQSVGPLSDHLVVQRLIRLEESDSVLTVTPFVAPDPLGGFIVADPGGSQVRLYTKEGRLKRLVATPGSGPGEVRVPLSAVRKRDGHLLVADVGNSVVLEFNSAGDAELARYPTPFQIVRLLTTAEGVLALGSRIARSTEPAPFLMHRWREGAVVESYFRTPATTATARTTLEYGFANAAANGAGEIIATFTLSDTLYVYSGAGHLVSRIALEVSNWTVPETDPTGALGSPARAAWLEGMTTVSAAYPVDDRILVQIGERKNGDMTWRLLCITASGQTLFDVADTPKLLTVDGDDLYFVDYHSPTPDSWVVARLR